jgi:predicted DNA-binding protein
MARNKVSTTVYLDVEQNEKLKLLHQRTKVPMAEYIREGVDLVLKKHQDKLPGQRSLLDDEAAPTRR